MKILFSVLWLCVMLNAFSQNNRMSLSGKWKVKLDADSEWVRNNNPPGKITGAITLPGSLAENGFGYKTTGSDFGILTPEYRYVGKAWYTREIHIPGSWKNKEVQVFLERVLWESRVFIDNREISWQDGLGTPHVHHLGKLAPGPHNLTILVNNDMIHNIGDKGHAYSDYTQSIWNGITGRMEMIAKDPLHILSVRTFPEIQQDNLRIEVTTNLPVSKKTKINYHILSVSDGNKVIEGWVDPITINEKNQVIFNVPVNRQLKRWSEFTPEVYELQVTLQSGKNYDSLKTEFGYSQFSHDGTKILVNGNPVFLRGNLDCVHFPLTGYPSCNLEDWERIFRIYKDYGLNHARFHSWCPPEAAFRAANRVGIYLQAEASVWIDWWMSTDMVARERPEMDTKGHPAGLGHDPERDSFIVAEMNRISDTYGNHPSFTLFCIGNELGNGDFGVMNQWIADLKTKDPRRLYAASTARQINKSDDYAATHQIPGVGRTRGLNGPRTDWDFEDTYGKMDIPVIAHEIGQWPVYPKWSEINKYTGVLKARNLLEFREQARKNGIGEQDHDFARASGALNQIMYKYETESFLRTASCAGVQLLSMQDYQGQGEALIGWLDCHWESKGITTPRKFREHFNITVPLLRMEKFVWTNTETFRASAQLSHHGEKLLNETVSWEILDENRKILTSGSFEKKQFAVGSLTSLGDIELSLNSIQKAQKLTVKINVDNTDFNNSWNFWVYPDHYPETEQNEVHIAHELNDSILEKLKNGASVLLDAHELGTPETSVTAHFYPLYWSLTFFPGQGKTCIGLLLQENHPAFTAFPTSFHSDWQWETISADAKGFILNDLPGKYRPIAQPVDDFHRNNKVGSIFELKVGKGKLLVCGYNLDSGLPVAGQLKTSLLEYMNSAAFDPQTEGLVPWLQAVFPLIPIAEKADVPGEFPNAILFVYAGAKLTTENQSVMWDPKLDEVKNAENTRYQVKADGVWKDQDRTAWHGRQIELSIDCPAGILGTLYVHFHDWNKNGRTGLLEFEGRKIKLGPHDGDGRWIQFHVMREDSNDGRLVLRASASAGPNLMITKIGLTGE